MPLVRLRLRLRQLALLVRHLAYSPAKRPQLQLQNPPPAENLWNVFLTPTPRWWLRVNVIWSRHSRWLAGPGGPPVTSAPQAGSRETRFPTHSPRIPDPEERGSLSSPGGLALCLLFPLLGVLRVLSMVVGAIAVLRAAAYRHQVLRPKRRVSGAF